MTISSTYNSSGTWQAPAGVTHVQVECWGAGATNPYMYNNPPPPYTSGGGGGGGAYSKVYSVPVKPGKTYNVTVGATGNGTSTDAQPSYFTGESSVQCYADHGTTHHFVAPFGEELGGPGGSASNCIGDVKYSGGNGGDGIVDHAGGGGGAAGNSANGSDGQSGSGTGAGGAGGSVGGGSGGQGGRPLVQCTSGNAPGGGCGGHSVEEAFAPTRHGAPGRVIISYSESQTKNISVLNVKRIS